MLQKFRGSFIFRGRKPYSNIVVTIIFAILYTLFVDDKGGEILLTIVMQIIYMIQGELV